MSCAVAAGLVSIRAQPPVRPVADESGCERRLVAQSQDIWKQDTPALQTRLVRAIRLAAVMLMLPMSFIVVERVLAGTYRGPSEISTSSFDNHFRSRSRTRSSRDFICCMINGRRESALRSAKQYFGEE